VACRARRRIVAIGAVIFVVFLATVAMRSPWRGFLAEGDSWGLSVAVSVWRGDLVLGCDHRQLFLSEPFDELDQLHLPLAEFGTSSASSSKIGTHVNRATLSPRFRT
jgi:hypothetical protein